MKKLIAVLVSLFFALSLGVVSGQEDTQKNPWEMNQPNAPAKKESKSKKKEKKGSKEKIKKGNKETGKKKKS